MPHGSMSIRFNLIVICAWSLVAAAGLLFGHPQALLTAGVGGVAGLLAGFLQWRSVRSAPQKFIEADSAIAVRRAFTSNRPGRLAVAMTWVSGAAILCLTLVQHGNPLAVFGAGYGTSMAAREIAALPAVFRLRGNVSVNELAG